MCDSTIAILLQELRSQSAGTAWVKFLDSYSSVLYQTARAHTSSEDAAADCYVYICEQLADNHFRRLLKFKPDGRASFTTWLRVVARNLCFDRHRGLVGRYRPFKAVSELSAIEREVYNLRHTMGTSRREAIQEIAVAFPAADADTVYAIEDRLQNTLTSRQHWILSMRQKAQFSATVAIAGEEGDSEALEIADPTPNQEALLLTKQQQEQLRRAIESLPSDESLLLQLRFEHDLTLDEVARLCGLGDGQRVHRRIAVVLKKLRSVMH